MTDKEEYTKEKLIEFFERFVDINPGRPVTDATKRTARQILSGTVGMCLGCEIDVSAIRADTLNSAFEVCKFVIESADRIVAEEYKK